MNHYIYRGTQKLRCGYTTGSCAAGAAKAAAEMLLTGQIVQTISIMTPAEIPITMDIEHAELHADFVSCAVRKDSGDDPDITNGINVYANVSRIESGIEILGGQGIGIVTKPGLNQPVGAYAINETPRKMIKSVLLEVADKYGIETGFRVILSIPNGEEIAKKTFNPRIGIIGGLSIIGTTGIVEPMSNQAIIETIRTEANIRKASGDRYIIFTIGNFSSAFVKENIPDLSSKCVTCSNFIGDAIDIAVTLGFENILLIGHIGKLVKLGSGIMNTHSAVADGRMETLVACAALAGIEQPVLNRISNCITTDAALLEIRHHKNYNKTMEILTNRIEYYLNARVKDQAKIAAIIFTKSNEKILKTSFSDTILHLITGEKT